MRRRHFTIPLLLLASMTIAACGRYSSNILNPDNQDSDSESSPKTNLNVTNTKQDRPEIVCWGDSMTAGTGKSKAIISTDSVLFDASNMSYPDILQKLTGIKTYNFGIPSATSEEIAILQGGLSSDNSSYLKKINKDILSSGKKHPGNILILEIGSNGGWDNYSELIAQYNAMIDHSGCTDYIIIGDTDDPANSADPLVYDYADNISSKTVNTSWDDALEKAFGQHFINMRLELISRGLSIAGLTETANDKEAAMKGNISEQLRADWTHFNSYGYYSKAVIIHEKGIQLGYWK